ncbi:MAG: hypothetical protein ABIH50_07880 [bacterium]
MTKTKNSKAIVFRNRLMLAHLALAKDKVFQKLPEVEKNEVIKKVITIGDETAQWVAGEYGTSDPRKIAAKMGLKIFGEERKNIKASEYRRKEREIIISRKFHEKLLREIESRELSERLLKIVVAQKLFLHLEHERLGEVYKRYKFVVWKVGPFVREKMVKALSEVAASAFTQTLLKFEVTPQVFDYLLMTSFNAS